MEIDFCRVLISEVKLHVVHHVFFFSLYITVRTLKGPASVLVGVESCLIYEFEIYSKSKTDLEYCQPKYLHFKTQSGNRGNSAVSKPHPLSEAHPRSVVFFFLLVFLHALLLNIHEM